ncbi:keratin-associated protein 9-3-like [Perognathus longimembris pacificus]|uniref:keratin-associated protein 9-3-like n=1 Tax=Perognathus longimembris pacificus TaxID=214514 RepID=UPI002019E94E|nr:keratin-associated protein 9-3-like [Perognathus longimembris pacificus]
MACCATSFCGFPSCSFGGNFGSGCCGQEGGSGAMSCRVRWCRPDCRVEGTCLPPCCVVSCTPPTCCQLHHAQASCCRPSYCGQSCCRPACCCYCC